MKLTTEEKYRYSRHLLLKEVGLEGQEKLKEAKVLVVGAGGLGCPVLLYLAAAGVGTIGVIDFDTVDASNLQRQILFSTDDVGRSKAKVAKEKLNANNSFIEVIAFNEELTNENALEIFSQFDIIVDGTDNFYTRYMVNDACLITNKPLVYGAIHKFEGQVSVFNYQEGPTYRCLFPTPPKAGSISSCSEVGVVGVLPGIIGTQQANEVIKIILGIGKVLSGKLLICNALESSFMEIKINKTVIEVLNKEEFSKFDYQVYCNDLMVMGNSITLPELINLSPDVFVVDVRREWEQPKLENKQVLYAPLQEIDGYIHEIPADKEVYVICQHGVRSKVAIEYLEKEYNFTNLINIEGGMLG
mgnify:CR=1 FL=1